MPVATLKWVTAVEFNPVVAMAEFRGIFARCSIFWVWIFNWHLLVYYLIRWDFFFFRFVYWWIPSPWNSALAHSRWSPLIWWLIWKDFLQLKILHKSRKMYFGIWISSVTSSSSLLFLILEKQELTFLLGDMMGAAPELPQIGQKHSLTSQTPVPYLSLLLWMAIREQSISL